MTKTSPKSKKSKKEIKRFKFSRHALLVFAVLFAAVGGFLLLKSRAASPPPPSAPSIYLDPAAASVNVGETFTVKVYEDSGSDSVNVVQANLAYSTSQLSYVSHTDSSAFTLVAENPIGDTGSLHFARGTCGGCTALTGNQLVVSVTFKALSAGTAAVNFDSGTLLVRSSDSTPEPGLNEAGGSYTISAPSSPPPPSPTPTPTPTPPPTGGGTTTHSSGTSSHTTTSTPTATSQPTSPTTTTTPTQTSSADLSSTPSTPENVALIPTSVKHLLQIAGIALIVGAALSFAGWFFQHMRGRLHRFHPNIMANNVITAPPFPQAPSAPSITVKPSSADRPAVTQTDGAKSQPGTVLQPNDPKAKT